MKNIDLNGHKIKLYNSIKELPAKRYSLYQKYLLLDGGVGSDLEAVERHFNRLDKFLGAGMLAEAIEERTNLHFNLFYQLNEVSFKGLSFGCLIYAIDGQPVTDFSEENLKQIINQLSDWGLTQQLLENELEEFRKKIEGELKGYFPEYFSNDALVNMLAQVQKKILAMLEVIKTENDALLPGITEMEKHVLSAQLPQNFDLNGPQNAVYQHETAFENLCACLEDAGAQNVAETSVFSLYAKVKYYESKFKAATK